MELGHHDRFGMWDSIERTPILDDRLRFPAMPIICQCGCGEEIFDIAYRTWDDEPVASAECLERYYDDIPDDVPATMKEAV